MSTVILVSRLLDVVLMLVANIPAMRARFQAIKDELDLMQAEGRDPTPEEWEARGQSIDDRLARLKAKQGG